MGHMAFFEFPWFNVKHILPVLIVVAFFLVYSEIVDKLLIWLMVKEHYSQQFTKEGLQKSVTDFVSTFHRLSEEILDYHQTKNDPEHANTEVNIKKIAQEQKGDVEMALQEELK